MPHGALGALSPGSPTRRPWKRMALRATRASPPSSWSPHPRTRPLWPQRRRPSARQGAGGPPRQQQPRRRRPPSPRRQPRPRPGTRRARRPVGWSAPTFASALAAAALVSVATTPPCAESAGQPLMATAPVFTHMLPGLMAPPSTSPRSIGFCAIWESISSSSSSVHQGLDASHRGGRSGDVRVGGNLGGENSRVEPTRPRRDDVLVVAHLQGRQAVSLGGGTTGHASPAFPMANLPAWCRMSHEQTNVFAKTIYSEGDNLR